MSKKILILVLLLGGTSVFGQEIIRSIDSLLLNALNEQAITLIDKNLVAANASQDILLKNKKAEALIRSGKFYDANTILKTLLASNTNSIFVSGVLKTTAGFLYLNEGRNDLAIQSLQEALIHFEKVDKQNSLEAAQAISFLGLAYNASGKYAQAEEQMQRALVLRQNILSTDHELIAASYNDLGLVFSQRDGDKALDFYEKALVIYLRLHGKEHPKIAFTNTNTAIVYRDLELYGDAINNFESALKIWEKIYPKPDPKKAFVLFNLGSTYLKMKDLKAAREYFQRALTMYRSSYGTKHPDIAGILNALGSLEISGSKFNEGLAMYQQALQANVSDFESNDESKNPKLQNFYNGNVLLYSLLYKAEAFEARHFGKTLKFNDLAIGLSTLQRCDSLIDKLRQQSSNESDKISLGVIANEVYADGVRIAYESASIAFKKKPYLELAFYFAEKSKSAVLLEAISDADAKSFAGIPTSLLEDEKNLKTAIALTAQKLAQKPSVDEEKYLRETSFNLNRSYETFIKNLEQQYPGYFNLKFNASSPSIKQLQGLLDNKTALLSYFTDEKNDRLYIFLITHKSYKIVDHALPKEFDKYITGLRNGIFFNVTHAYAKAAENLAKLLLPVIPLRIKELVILPTGRLSIIPFETLLTKHTNSSTSYQSLSYLINRFTVRYEFSAGLLLQKVKQPVKKPDAIFLCAPVTFPAEENLSELPGTESEVKEISQLFASKNVAHDAYTRLEATEHLIKSNSLKKYSVLHFATHGVVDEINPELSKIFLQNGSDDEDGNLFAGEIYNLELEANLVTLSACQTGLGKISKGEGVIGLSRALVYAGAKNIIVSFWSVADESTAELMKKFYEGLLNNPSTGYSHNLREAKLSILKSEKYAAPYYWAPFILIGF
jgi:CHAT domain-containing protein/Tfp pilus assembly protein PilF